MFPVESYQVWKPRFSHEIAAASWMCLSALRKILPAKESSAAALPTCRVTAKATGCGNVDFPVKTDVPAPGSFFKGLG